MSVGAGNKSFQQYQPPVADYRKRLGRKEVHHPQNKELRQKMKDRPAHKVSIQAKQDQYTAKGLWSIAAAVGLVIAIAMISQYRDSLPDMPVAGASVLQYVKYERIEFSTLSETGSSLTSFRGLYVFVW